MHPSRVMRMPRGTQPRSALFGRSDRSCACVHACEPIKLGSSCHWAAGAVVLCGCQVAQWKLPPIRTLPGASPRQLAAADVRGGGAAPTAIVDAELHACLAEFDEVRRCKSRRRYKYNRGAINNDSAISYIAAVV